MVKYGCHTSFAFVVKVLDNLTHVVKTMHFKFVHLFDYLVTFGISRIDHCTQGLVRLVEGVPPVDLLLETWNNLCWITCTICWRSTTIQSTPLNSATGNSTNVLNSTISSGHTPLTSCVKNNPKFDHHRIRPKIFGHVLRILWSN